MKLFNMAVDMNFFIGLISLLALIGLPSASSNSEENFEKQKNEYSALVDNLVNGGPECLEDAKNIESRIKKFDAPGFSESAPNILRYFAGACYYLNKNYKSAEPLVKIGLEIDTYKLPAIMILSEISYSENRPDDFAFYLRYLKPDDIGFTSVLDRQLITATLSMLEKSKNPDQDKLFFLQLLKDMKFQNISFYDQVQLKALYARQLIKTNASLEKIDDAFSEVKNPIIAITVLVAKKNNYLKETKSYKKMSDLREYTAEAIKENTNIIRLEDDILASYGEQARLFFMVGDVNKANSIMEETLKKLRQDKTLFSDHKFQASWFFNVYSDMLTEMGEKDKAYKMMDAALEPEWNETKNVAQVVNYANQKLNFDDFGEVHSVLEKIGEDRTEYANNLIDYYKLCANAHLGKSIKNAPEVFKTLANSKAIRAKYVLFDAQICLNKISDAKQTLIKILNDDNLVDRYLFLFAYLRNHEVKGGKYIQQKYEAFKLFAQDPEIKKILDEKINWIDIPLNFANFLD